MKRQLRILQIAIGQMIVDQLLDAVMRDQEIPPPEESQQRPPGDRENVVPRSARARCVSSCSTPFERGIAGIIGAVQGADAGADHHIRGNSVRGERMHHAHLNGAKAAAAREHKGRFRRARPGWIRTSLVAPRYRRVGDRPRDVRRRYSSRKRATLSTLVVQAGRVIWNQRQTAMPVIREHRAHWREPRPR